MSAAPVLQVGMSPCPNDTFMFHALVKGVVAAGGLRFAPTMLDIEQLNQRALGDDPLPVTKLSVPALGRALDRYAVLDAGAALGRGVGPLVVQRRGVGRGLDELRGRRIAVPGALTTAFLLLQIFGPGAFEPVVLRFDEILGAVARGEVDAGLIIHESRFTYRDHGLEAVCDLGELWEADTGLPLPLGLIAARRDLGAATANAVAVGLAASVRAAFADPGASAAWVREHAQEMDADVCARHIELYVNDASIALGSEGRAAVRAMLQRGRDAGAWGGDPGPHRFWPGPFWLDPESGAAP